MIETRIDRRFAALKNEGRAAFVSFITAGDPDLQTSLQLMKKLPEAGTDVIELGMPFSDPMADGPAIQLSSQRALNAGHTMAKTLEMVREFRKGDNETPIILMGYYNPIYVYPADKFLADALAAGVDGLIIVDLPPETDTELCLPARDVGINFIRLATPTTDEKRLPAVLKNASGFLYYVSIAGITGTATPDPHVVHKAVAAIKQSTDMPVAVGFGVKTRQQVSDIARGADGVVVGSAIVSMIADSLDGKGAATSETVERPLALVKELSGGVFDILEG